MRFHYLAAAVFGFGLAACAEPAYEAAFKTYNVCLTEKRSVEACQLEKANWEAEALHAQVQARGAAYIPPPPAPVYSAPRPVVIPMPTVTAPAYGPPSNNWFGMR